MQTFPIATPPRSGMNGAARLVYIFDRLWRWSDVAVHRPRSQPGISGLLTAEGQRSTRALCLIGRDNPLTVCVVGMSFMRTFASRLIESKGSVYALALGPYTLQKR